MPFRKPTDNVESSEMANLHRVTSNNSTSGSALVYTTKVGTVHHDHTRNSLSDRSHARKASTAVETGSMVYNAGDGPHDPLNLTAHVASKDKLDALRKRKHGKRSAKRIAAFYEEQNLHIDNLLKPVSQHVSEAKAEEDANKLKVKVAIYASMAANFLLAGLQLYAAISSLSLSFFATAADSVFDPFVLWYPDSGPKLILRQTVDPLKWPGGGAKFETIGNICYGFLMLSVNFIIIVESIRGLATSDKETTDLNIPALATVAASFAIKFALFLYCYSLKKQSSQVQVLWEDHRNDLFINGFGILTNAGGAKLAYWIDPAGAIVIAVAVITSWTRTCMAQFALLAGKSASPDVLQLIVYKAMHFDSDIEQIDSCRAYHSGPELLVEVDIVMNGVTPLWKAHDISQALQDQLETLPWVDRAFVHVDHETSHAPEHKLKTS